MNQTIRATYRNGTFFAESPCDLPNETLVDLLISPAVMPPIVTAPEERTEILRRLAERMRATPIPTHSPKFSREELHERR